MKYRVPREPINTCPPEFLDSFIGPCFTCYRPMALKRRILENQELLRWFIGAVNSRVCGTCYQRPVPRVRRRRQPRQADGRLTSQRIRELRTLVGACPDCGWKEGVAEEEHADRGCPSSSLADHDLRESA
jgi:hypothetical protein